MQPYNNLIITHKDGRTWNEGQLEDLLRDADAECRNKDIPKGYASPQLQYYDGEWKVWFLQSSLLSIGDIFPLDPSLYTVSPVGMIAVEKVREMVEELSRYRGYQTPSRNKKCVEEIASKYLGEEN